MMSHSHGKVLTDKQNIFHIFRKHQKTSGKSCSPIMRCTSKYTCCTRHNKNTEAKHSQKHKAKRLKTRKERNHVRGCEGEGSKIISQHHRLHQNHKERDHCQGCCQSSTCPPSRKDAPFARVFPSAQEPSIITDSRLTGHHGLFNHEVKSIDIERLLGEQRKLETGRRWGGKKNHSAPLPLALNSPIFPISPGPVCNTEEVGVCKTDKASDNKKAERATTSTKVRSNCKSTLDITACSSGDAHGIVQNNNACIQVSVEEEGNLASRSNSYESGITPGQRQRGTVTSSDCDIALLSSTDSPFHIPAVESKEGRHVVPETVGKYLLQKENSRLKDTQVNALSQKETPQNIGYLQPCTQSDSPSPQLAQASLNKRVSASSEPRQTDQARRPNPVSAVAARLCRSLELPLLSRRHLLVESREVLLQALRDRHGPQLQENLLKVQRRLSFGTRPIREPQGLSSRPPAVDRVSGTQPAETGMEQSSILEPQRPPGLKRRRKQLCPLRVSPPQSQMDGQSQQGQGMSVPWATNHTVEHVGDLFGELLRPPASSSFQMDILPSCASSPHHMFDPPSATQRGGQACPPRSWDEHLTRGARETTRKDCFDIWRYDLDLSFPNQTGTVIERGGGPQWHDRSRQSSVQNPMWTPEGDPKVFQNPFELDRSRLRASSSSSSAPPQHSLENRQLHPFYRFNRPPPSPTPVSHCPDMTCYPPSHMLERGLSPSRAFLPAFPSPEKWSFPPMRLY
ncbi:uncharacterized protein si:dkey-250k15.4 isoform X2 [Osmerus eperlanus]|uniref:uncharacterized protein si:dkey-250k15.4 isoform X2 n=1 Tax=Osmerus eperlanus TaxID=29151 RepID=UPI002E0D8E6D